MAGSPPCPVVTPAPSPRGRPPASARLTPSPQRGLLISLGLIAQLRGADAPRQTGHPGPAPQHLAWRLFTAETSLKGHRPQAGSGTTGVPSDICFESHLVTNTTGLSGLTAYVWGPAWACSPHGPSQPSGSLSGRRHRCHSPRPLMPGHWGSCSTAGHCPEGRYLGQTSLSQGAGGLTPGHPFSRNGGHLFCQVKALLT